MHFFKKKYLKMDFYCRRAGGQRSFTRMDMQCVNSVNGVDCGIWLSLPLWAAVPSKTGGAFFEHIRSGYEGFVFDVLPACTSFTIRRQMFKHIALPLTAWLSTRA